MAYLRQTLDQLVESLTEAVGDNVIFWGRPEKIDAINEAICIWQVMTGRWTVMERVQTTSNYVTFPTTISSVLRVRVVTVSSTREGVPLTLSSVPELDYGVPGWEAVTGIPAVWVPIGINEFALYPSPTALTTLLVEGLTDAPRLFSDGDFIDLPEEDYQALLHYAHHYLTFKEAGAEFQATQEHLVDFVENAALQNARMKKTAPYRRLMGINKEEGERGTRGPATQIGVRSNE